MKTKIILLSVLAVSTAPALVAQPAWAGPAPAQTVIERADLRRAAYVARIDEMLSWKAGTAKPGELLTDMAVKESEIDEDAAEDAVQRAEEAMRSSKMSDEEYATVKASLQKSLAQIRVKRRRS